MMMMNENVTLVSVIITTYNRELSILKRAIESVISQTYKNLEVLVINDYPENKELCREIYSYIVSLNDNRVCYYRQEKNSGACHARNTGIMKSHGKFIAFLDDDDEWHSRKIENQLTLFTSEKIGVVYCFYNNINLNGTVDKVVPCTNDGNLTRKLLLGNCIGGTSMPLIRREAFERIGLFDENLLSSQDHDMWLRISEKFDFVCCKEYLVNRYMQFESITTNIEKQRQGFELFISKHLLRYQNDKGAYNFILNQKAKQWFVSGHIKESLSLYYRAVSAKPLSIRNITEPIKAILLILKK